MDLWIAPGPGLPGGLMVPGALLVERFSRSPGPGGQSVNTADSRVELEIRLGDLVPLLTLAAAERLLGRLGADLDGRVVVSAKEHRSQRRNRVAARERLALRIRDGLAPPPPPRRATKPSRGSTERRLQGKRRRAQTKAGRARPGTEG